MSVLSFPRIYFKGFMSWDPCTANNNDYLPVYDAATAQLDWDYLATQGITPANFQDTFRTWAMRPQTDSCPPSSPGQPNQDNCSDSPTCHMGSRWDYYGSGACNFLQYKSYTTLTVGGDLGFGNPAASNDPILNQPIALTGNTFGGKASSARLVDVNPSAPWSSQICFAGLAVGGQTISFGGPAQGRMYSRQFFVPRNVSSDLIIAGAIGVVFQTAIPTAAITSTNAAASPLLTALLAAAGAAGAQGLMLRFSAYNTLYYKNGTYNDFPVAASCDQLSQLYLDGQVFANPAYSRVAGVFGVWKDGELVNAPGGRSLLPIATVAPVTPLSATASVRSFGKMRISGHDGPLPEGPGSASLAAEAAGPSLALGGIRAEVDTGAGLVSLDLSNAIPEYTAEGAKFDYGPITVVAYTGGSLQPIGAFDFSHYDQAAYEAKGGIVDVPFGAGLSAEASANATAANVATWLATGDLALDAQNKLISYEKALTAASDEQGVYVDECREQSFTVQVQQNGAPAPDGTNLLLAEYYPWPLQVGAGQWQLAGTVPEGGGGTDVCTQVPASPYLRFLDGATVPVVGGMATIRLAARAPGFPVLTFYPYLAGQPVPVPQAQVTFGFQSFDTTSIDNAPFVNVRTLPFDNALVAQFVDRWNGTGQYAGQPKYNRELTWEFIYGNILYVYDMLFPVMDLFMPLGDLRRVEGAIDQLVMMVSESMLQSTLYMPVTRELSAAKRLILETWGNLVIRKYPQQDLPALAVPCDFVP